MENSHTMKIAILTLQFSNNYGAMFQAYALSRHLEQDGHEVVLLNYHQDIPTVSKYLRNPIAFFRKILGKGAISLNFIQGKLSDSRGKAVEKDFREIFDTFRRDHLEITPAVPVHFSDLSAALPEIDALIVGSDQVWAADFVFSSPAYLLAFSPPGTRRISYAASFGKAHLEGYLQKAFSEEIRKFDAVSVREKSGVELVSELSGIEATHVVDPTLLISDYSEIVDDSLVPDGDYILSYRLSQSAELSDWVDDSIAALASEMGLPVYAVSTNIAGADGGDVRHLQPTPGQLLGLIEKARFLATNSFHGTVFALNFRTPFLTFARDSAEDKQNLRLTELLGGIGSPQRFCEPFAPIKEVLSKVAAPQDFASMHTRLQQRRVASIAFLKDALRA